MADLGLSFLSRFSGYYEMTDADQQWLDGEIEHLNYLAKRTIADILEIGKRLAAIQAKLANYHDGYFVSWIREECVWSKSTVYNFIKAYERFGSFPTVGKLTIDQKALYLLAADSTPESARTEAIERASAGELMTHKLAKEIIATHQPPKFTIATAPHVPEPRPPRTTSNPSSASETWIFEMCRQVMAIQETQTTHDVAMALTPDIASELSAVIDFLREVKRIHDNLQNTDDNGFQNHFA